MRANFREMRDRFAHIDGAVDDLRFSRSEPSFVAIRFYPWWEHPRVVAAIAEDRNWRVQAPPDAARVMVIHAIDPVHLTADLHTSAEEIVFHDSGPRLWPFETNGSMYINDPVPPDVVSELADRTGIAERDLTAIASVLASSRVPYALGAPPSVHAALHAILDERGVSHLATYAGAPSNLVAFEFDDNLLVAHDFEVDVPDWEHRDEWVL
jgi:hypothetical protein